MQAGSVKSTGLSAFLPPDQYLALVVQATEGCSYNQCTFCDFYRDRPFRVKSADELRAHIAAVRAFFGPALGLRKSLFLADANALVVPMPRLRAWLDVIAEDRLLSVDAGIFSFMDAFDVQRKTADEWAELAARGLAARLHRHGDGRRRAAALAAQAGHGC